MAPVAKWARQTSHQKECTKDSEVLSALVTEDWEDVPNSRDDQVATQFHLLGVPHILIISAIPLAAGLLAWLSRKHENGARAIRLLLGGSILLNELVWYWYYVHQGWFEFPYTLPLHLCDVVLWLTIYTSFSQKQWSYNLIYYWGLAGTTMAVVTPDVSAPVASYLTIRFFLAHGGILIVILFLTWGGILRPSKGSYWKAWVSLQVYIAAISIFNYFFRTNYFYICEKPDAASLLNFMGPWPVYVLVGDAIALILFWFLYLPYRGREFAR